MQKQLTPMMAQYLKIKSEQEDAFLFFRLGDFYELFNEDALEASKLLNITLTKRGKDENATPMCGVPFHAAAGYIAKLTRLGKKVAICDQVSDPSEPGIVKREVVRIVTPGTTLDEKVLDSETNNFIAAVCKGGKDGKKYAFAFADASTGRFEIAELKDQKMFHDVFAKISPKEAICSQDIIHELKANFEQTYFFPFESFKESERLLKDHFQVKSLDGFGIQDDTLAIKAAALLLHYLQDTQKQELTHVRSIKPYQFDKFMHLDLSTIRNLELLRSIREGGKEGSLFWVIDKTLTAMGGRMLVNWLMHPLLEKNSIDQRLDAVSELVSNTTLLQQIQNILKDILDIERLLGRLSLGSGNARDLLALKQSLQNVPNLKSLLENFNSNYLSHIQSDIDECSELTELIEGAIDDEAPLTLRDGRMIKGGFHEELDRLREIASKGKNFIIDLQKREIQRTGINSLKVKYNKVFGYYIEISKSNLNNVPDDYTRKQTLVNAERFITPELKEYEEAVLGAEDKMKDLEYDLFCELRDQILNEIDILQNNANLIAELDVLLCFAELALKNKYVRPEIFDSGSSSNRDNATAETNSGGIIDIKNGRHPVVEQISVAGSFVPNDTFLNNDVDQIHLITGPNMGGKSTYLRQVALISLMAQIGSFVPADSAKLSIVDRIFTRVGASDNLVRGQSTFMVEMQEASNILHNATKNSLIILDEIGRGTSTYDGVSIAWAILEYVHDVLSSKTLFASHYHELIAVCDGLERAQNYSVAVKENEQDGVVFLYKIAKGGVDKSYGIEVAKLAGMPHEIVLRAKGILNNLEEGQIDSSIKKQVKKDRIEQNKDQIDMFNGSSLSQRDHKTLQNIREIDVNKLTPLEALQKLASIKEDL